MTSTGERARGGGLGPRWTALPGTVLLPDGTAVHGRGRRRGAVPDPPAEWSLVLAARPPAEIGPGQRWLRWADFRRPADPADAVNALREAYGLAAAGLRVEVTCAGGRGRSGTALACIAQFGGVGAEDAVVWVREHYHPRAVETPGQRRFVRQFGACRGSKTLASQPDGRPPGAASSRLHATGPSPRLPNLQ